jgi:4-hydroxybenzoate polyprenyltransferase
MRLTLLLELGRVSNLPTVWSNVLCGVVLGGTAVAPLGVALVLASSSLLYVGGMLLNDAFDAEVDARERPERPIPSGRASKREVFALGFELLVAAVVLLAIYALLGASAVGYRLPLVGFVTALTIVLYDRFHKGHAFAPLIMGLCRGELYVLAACAGASAALSAPLFLAAAALAAYVVGLTHIARFETASVVGRVWPTTFVLAPSLLAGLRLLQEPLQLMELAIAFVFLTLCSVWALRSVRLALRGGRGIGAAVGALIAGISLVDAMLLASHGASLWSFAALLCFLLTLRWQRRIRGT